ncbi:immunity 52 family protein [Xenorhabdus bovienii]|uniref:immunity 52 family protein n=1 Tax=Xenorhabdus bovienii TaxID=40576 RepID=UPI003DA3FA71
MKILPLRITIYSNFFEQVTPQSTIENLDKVIRHIDQFFGRKKIWYLTGDSREQALEKVAFNKQGGTKEAIKEFEKEYTSEMPLIAQAIWDGEDGKMTSGIQCHNFVNGDYNKVKISLSLNIKENEYKFPQLVDFIKKLAFSYCAAYILIETRGYTLKDNNVFPDRLSAGWMLYLPTEIDPALIPLTEEILPIPDKKNNIGTLIITTKDIFDIENKEHINKANDIEICLRDLGLLPLISEV